MKNIKQKQKNKNYLKITISIIILFCTLFSYQFIYASSISEEKLGDLLNQTRKENQLPELEWNSKLYIAAHNKAAHMIDNNYFEHFAPDGTSPWDFINKANYSYKIAGENLAIDFNTSEAIHDAWLSSPSHKENIINQRYTEYAIAVENGIINGQQTILIVQMFATPNEKIIDKTMNLANKVLSLLLGKNILY